MAGAGSRHDTEVAEVEVRGVEGGGGGRAGGDGGEVEAEVQEVKVEE